MAKVRTSGSGIPEGGSKDINEILKSHRNMNESILLSARGLRQLEGKVDQMFEHFTKICHVFKTQLDAESKAKREPLNRRLIKSVIDEIYDPKFRQNSLEVKSLKKIIDEFVVTLEDHRRRHMSYQDQLDLINVTILRQLKNTDNEREMLDRELKRMQNIDRAKVTLARQSLFNVDTGEYLPKMDTFHASKIDNSSLETTSRITKDIVPHASLSGECERLK